MATAVGKLGELSKLSKLVNIRQKRVIPPSYTPNIPDTPHSHDTPEVSAPTVPELAPPPPPTPEMEIASLRSELSGTAALLAEAERRAAEAESALEAAWADKDSAVKREIGTGRSVGKMLFHQMVLAQIRAARAEKDSQQAKREGGDVKKDNVRKSDDVVLVSAMAALLGVSVIDFFLHAVWDGDVANRLLYRILDVFVHDYY